MGHPTLFFDFFIDKKPIKKSSREMEYLTKKIS